MTATHVALLRGINVGKAKRVAMAELRALVTGLGYEDVRTLLNSGNVVLRVPTKATAGEVASRIERSMESQLGVKSRVTVLTAGELRTAIDENPFSSIATNPSRLFVAVLTNPADRKLLQPLTSTNWSPDRFAIGSRAAYLWCPHGMMESRLSEAVGRALGDGVTTRNWATLSKLHALTGG